MNARQQAVIELGTSFSGNPYFKLPKLEALTDDDFKGLTPEQQDNVRFLIHKLTQRALGEDQRRAEALRERFGAWDSRATPKQSAALAAGREASKTKRAEELRQSTDPKDNGAKIKAIQDGTLTSASLYRKAHAGPSGQRTDIRMGTVRHTPDNPSGEFQIRDNDGNLTGWASHTVRNGETVFSVHSENADGAVRLEGWAGELSTAADVLINGQYAARGSGHNFERISKGSFEPYAGRNMSVEELELHGAREELRKVRAELGNSKLGPQMRKSLERREASLEADIADMTGERRADSLRRNEFGFPQKEGPEPPRESDESRRARNLATMDGRPPTDGRPDITAVATGNSKNDFHRWSLSTSKGRDRTMAPDIARVGGGAIDNRPARAELLNPVDGTGDYRYRIFDEDTGELIEEGTGRDAGEVFRKADRIFSSQRDRGMARTAGSSVRFEARRTERPKDRSRGDLGKGPFYDYTVVQINPDGSERVKIQTSSMSRAEGQAADLNRKEVANTPAGAPAAPSTGKYQTFAQRMAGDMSEADLRAARAAQDERMAQARAAEAERARLAAEARANDTRTEREKLTDLLLEQRAARHIGMRSGRVDPKREARIKAAEDRLAELDTEDRKARLKESGIRKGDKVTTRLGEFEVVGTTKDGYLRVVRPDGRRGSVDPKSVESVTKASSASGKA